MIKKGLLSVLILFITSANFVCGMEDGADAEVADITSVTRVISILDLPRSLVSLADDPSHPGYPAEEDMVRITDDSDEDGATIRLYGDGFELSYDEADLTGGTTMLHLAAAAGDITVLRIELQQHHVNVCDDEGLTPLHYAAKEGKVETVNELLSWDADIDAQDSKGRTSLFFAASRNRLHVVESLLASGANRNLATADGRTPLAVAESNWFEEVVMALDPDHPPLNVARAVHVDLGSSW
jgi:hypothetical protein